MNNELKDILTQLSEGNITVNEAMLKIRTKPFEDIDFAKIDLHRKARQGFAEVIYGEGKTSAQIIKIINLMQSNNENLIMVTRLSNEKAAEIKRILPLEYYDSARIGIMGALPEANGIGKIAVVTGGTSDIPVAEEAVITAMALGNEITRLYDVGVAGLHRLLSHMDELMSASVVIAIAGMEGALASVVGGLVDCPVIAVPTSVGYGASFNGLAPLLSMLNSCSAGISVVNIDNGFGAGFLASRINHMEKKI